MSFIYRVSIMDDLSFIPHRLPGSDANLKRPASVPYSGYISMIAITELQTQYVRKAQAAIHSVLCSWFDSLV